jgi:hypothetical protein
MDLFGYIIYLALAYIITVHVGLVFYRNGRVFILNLMGGDEQFTNAINNLLLVGYYLLNLGYCAVMITMWEPIDSPEGMINNLSFMLSRIILLLGIMHYINMAAIYLLSKKHKFHPNIKHQ